MKISFKELEEMFPFETFPGNPIIRSQTGDWKDSQIYDPVVLQDPSDPDGLLMYASGMTKPTKWGVQSIGRFRAKKRDPFNWKLTHGPVFSCLPGSSWESGAPESGVRLGSVLYDDASHQFFLYYTGGEPMNFQIGLATSPDGIDWVRDPAAEGLVVSPACDEYAVNDPAVVRFGSKWYMYFGYRRHGSVLEGIRMASSDDGRLWSRSAETILGRGDPGSCDSDQIEWHQVVQLSDGFALLYECFDGKSYSLALAHAETPEGPFEKSNRNPVLKASGIPGTFDRYHVATGSLIEFDGRILLYYSGAFDHTLEYGTSHWDLGAAIGTLSSLFSPLVRHPHFITGS